jgi:hypothetical protein
VFGGSESFNFFNDARICIKDLLPSCRGLVAQRPLNIGGGTLSADATLKLNATRSPGFMETVRAWNHQASTTASAESRRRYRSEKRESNGIGVFPTNTAR